MDEGTEVGLLEFLATAARRTSDARLAVHAGLGMLAMTVFLWLRPPGWLVLGAAGVCSMSFGAWGMSDRELRERERPGAARGTIVALQVVRATSLVVGGIAALTIIFGLAGLALGTIIS